jgi:FlaA1/EpsC-like NDP-sugar epimerase
VRTNVYGTRIVAEKAIEFGAESFVMISTDKAVNPINVMGMTKKIAEEIVIYLASGPASNGTQFMTVRFGNVLESSGSVVPLFKEQINRGGPVTVTHPEMTRFMTISEAVACSPSGSNRRGRRGFRPRHGKSCKDS